MCDVLTSAVSSCGFTATPAGGSRAVHLQIPQQVDSDSETVENQVFVLVLFPLLRKLMRIGGTLDIDDIIIEK